MNGTDGEALSLESAVASVYAGPLDDFIRRRDAVAKDLRSNGRRDDAATIKTLRKPSRAAWALNAAAVEADGAIEALIGAVTATLDAQASGGDVRGAMGALRAAVRKFAASAVDAAAQGGQRLEEATLANAVLAVIGRPADFEALRDGRLVDVPEAGGLDFLASLPPPPAAPVRAPKPAKPASASTAPARAAASAADAEPSARKRAAVPPAAQAAAQAANREALRRAAAAVAAARARATVAQQKLGAIDSRLATAEARLRQAEQEVVILRGERDRAMHDAEVADAQMREAEQSVAEAERQIEGA